MEEIQPTVPAMFDTLISVSCQYCIQNIFPSVLDNVLADSVLSGAVALSDLGSEDQYLSHPS